MIDRKEEMAAVRTTIVGGRPPGSGRSDTAIPRGMEVLVKKAAVDGEFRQVLLAQRGGAAAAIGLELDPAEKTMLRLIPEAHLARIIDQTVVPTEQRRAFLGQMAAAMLAVLGVGLAGCKREVAQSAGVRPEETTASKGIRPDIPPASNTIPDPPVSQGIRPDIPPRTTSAPATTTAPATSTEPSEPVSRGIRPDRPPTTTAPGTAPATQASAAPPDMRVIAGDTADRPPQTAPATPPADTQPRVLPVAGIVIDRP